MAITKGHTFVLMLCLILFITINAERIFVSPLTTKLLVSAGIMSHLLLCAPSTIYRKTLNKPRGALQAHGQKDLQFILLIAKIECNAKQKI